MEIRLPPVDQSVVLRDSGRITKVYAERGTPQADAESDDRKTARGRRGEVWRFGSAVDFFKR